MQTSNPALPPPHREPEEEAILDQLVAMYFPLIKEKIYLKAEEMATGRPTPKDFMAALQLYIPGEPFAPVKQRWSWINQNVTGFMAITALMTVLFGVLGIVPQVKVDGFLEIAKIFAGALVGGAAGAAAGSRRS